MEALTVASLANVCLGSQGLVQWRSIWTLFVAWCDVTEESPRRQVYLGDRCIGVRTINTSLFHSAVHLNIFSLQAFYRFFFLLS